ncbi:hypothetical protein A2572_01205 [Candidatus Collierbacteria bacterium RIFOXYD1_FULL_40_9]|uniref:Uncharacterized protein n=1 Tax=Candidatus Collierbacteria bacterium RIFOXYD1_FULL_40_9 TaxID=1817731 RepID=A0A1F5FP52_9BACT|nr:MAG: hypothetical protein A2572_01205 [Candidatus Collierbacteria bacterium RIFOXYD1_FULL_40_9]
MAKKWDSNLFHNKSPLARRGLLLKGRSLFQATMASPWIRRKVFGWSCLGNFRHADIPAHLAPTI